MMMFETSKPVPKTEKRCCVLKDNCFIWAYTEDRKEKMLFNVDF